jgi:hypothetical protein
MKIESIEEAIDILMTIMESGVVSPDPPEEGASLHEQLTYIASGVKKEVFWKSVRLWFYGSIIFPKRVYKLMRGKFKKVKAACKYLLKSKELNGYLEKHAYYYFFNQTGLFAKPSWRVKYYSSGDLQKERGARKRSKNNFGGCFERSGVSCNSDETYNVVRVMDGKTGETTYRVDRRKKTPIEKKLGSFPMSTTLVTNDVHELGGVEMIRQILNETMVKLGIELDIEATEKIIKRVDDKLSADKKTTDSAKRLSSAERDKIVAEIVKNKFKETDKKDES